VKASEQFFHLSQGPRPHWQKASRAQGPSFKIVPLKLDSFLHKTLPRHSSSSWLRWWGSIAHGLTKLVRLFVRGSAQAEAQFYSMADWLGGLVLKLPVGLADADLKDLPGLQEWIDFISAVKQVSLQDLVEWSAFASQALLQVRRFVLEQGRRSFVQWVTDQALPQNHCKALYRWTKGISPSPAHQVKGIWHPGLVADPVQLLQHRRYQWRQLWDSSPVQAVEGMEQLRDLIKLAREQKPFEFSLAEFEESLYTFRDATAQGLDCMGPLFLKHLPSPARQQWLEVVNFCIAQVCWPWQTSQQLVILLGKPKGGRKASCPDCLLPKAGHKVLSSLY
jgi:hypothetical protein